MTFGSKSPFKRDDDDEEDDEEEDDELTSGKSGRFSSGPDRPGMGAFMSSSARKDDNKGNDSKAGERRDPFKPNTPSAPANKPSPFGSSSSAFGSPRPGSPPPSTPAKKDESPAPKSGGFSFGGSKPPEKKDEPAKPAGGGAFGSSGSSSPFARKPDDKKDEPAKPASSSPFGSSSSSSPFARKPDDKKDEPKKDEPAKPAGGGLFGRLPGGGSPAKPDDKKDDSKKDEPAKPAGGGLFGRLPGGGSPAKPDDKKDEPKKDEPAKPAGGGLFGRLPGGGSPAKPDDKKDEPKKDEPAKPAGGLFGRFGGGGASKPDDKKDEPKKDAPKPVTSGTPPPPSSGAPKFGTSGSPPPSSGAPKPFGSGSSATPSKPGDPPRPGGSFGSSSPSPSKPADAPKPTSGGFSSSQSTFGKPASPSSPSSGSNISSGGSKPISPAFGSAKPGDPKPASPATSAAPAKKDDKAVAPAAPAGGGGFLSRLRPGGEPAKPDAKPAAKAGDEPPRTGFSVKGLFNRGAQAEAAPAKPGSKSAPAPAGKKVPGKDAPPTRVEGKAAKPLEKGASKDVKVKRQWSRDQQIDVVGIGLMLLGAIILFGVISPGNPNGQEAFLTGPIVRVIGQFFGYGRYFLFLPCWYVGGILIVRHFGDNPLEIQYSRIVGWGLVFLVLFATLQQIEMFQPPVPTLEVLGRNSAMAAAAMRGGGLVGDKIYMLLMYAVGDYATFAILLAWWVIAVMLALEITLSEITGYVQSVARWVLGVQAGFQASAERARANRELRQMEAQKLQAAQVTAGAAAPTGATTALPPGQRGNLLNAGNVPPPPAPDAKLTTGVPGSVTTAQAATVPVAAEPKRGLGGIFSRGSGDTATAAPPSPAPTTTPPPASSPEPAKPTAGGIFTRTAEPAAAVAPAAPAATSAPPATSKPAPGGIFSRPTSTPEPAKTEAAPEPVKVEAAKPSPFGLFNRNKPSEPPPVKAEPPKAAEPAKVETPAPVAASASAVPTVAKSEPAKPAEAAKPSPFGLFNRNKPSEPASTNADSAKPAEPAKVEPAKPADAAKPSPFGLFNRNKPSEPAAASADPAKPAEPAKSSAPSTPAKTEVIPPDNKTAVIADEDTKATSVTSPMKPVTPDAKPADAEAKIEPARPAFGASGGTSGGGSPFAPKPPTSSPFAPKPAEPEKKPEDKPTGGSLFAPKPPGSGSPFAPKPADNPAEIVKSATSSPAASTAGTGSPTSPFGAPKPPGTGLFGSKSAPSAQSAPSTPSSAATPSNFATNKPAANADLDDADDMEDDDADEPIDMKPATPKFGGANSPFAPKPSVPFGSKSRPAPKPSQLPLNDKPDDEEDDLDEAEEADIPAAKPASPFGSKPAGASPFAPKPAQPAAASPSSNPNPNAPRSPFGSPGGSPSGGSPSNRPPVTTTPAQPEKKADEPAIVERLEAKPLAPVASTTSAPPPADSKPSAPAEPVIVRSKQAGVWEMPEYSDLLERGSLAKADQEYLNERARIIEDTLQSFGSPGKVVEINTGPVITQFGVEPDYLVSRQGKKTRVKVGSIAKLDADLALALAARTIRIEAPVPGKGYVGIEVPNSKPSVVSLRDIMDEPAYQKINSRLRVALGRSVDGHPIVADLTTMPHLLIAGTTGSGKSVCVNAIISTLLLENSPDDLRFIMVDPKRVELTGYNGIPHLVEGMPVVVDLERIVGVLKWVTREMEERYKRFAAATARNIVDFNSKLPPGGQKLPYLVVVIDELADLMMLAPEETEKTLARLAQMARATGIHLIVSTQRPSVDVVTGLIKANFPARISFAVASSVDSRVILDQPGAEKLLGRGDMLYQAPDAAAPMRCQGVYLSDNEITKITQYWKGQRGRSTTSPSLAPPNRAIMDVPPAEPIQSRSERLGITNGTGSGSKPGTPAPANKLFEKDPPGLSRPAVTSAPPSDDDNELYAEAVKIYNENDGKVGIQLLQRRLRVGYMRAARLIDLMKQRGLNIDNKAGVSEEAVEDEE